MKPAPLLLFLPLLFPVTVMAARPLAKPELRADGRYDFRDSGSRAKFRIAPDELQESGPGVSKRVSITARDHLRKVQETAKQMSSGSRKMDLVAYQEDRPQTEANRRVVTERVAVTLSEGIDPTTIGQAAGAVGMDEVAYLPGDYVLTFSDATSALTAAEAMKALPGVLRSSVLLAKKAYPAFIPDDPYFGLAGTPILTYAFEIGDDYAELKARLNPRLVIRQPSATRAYQWYHSAENSYAQTPLFLGATYEDKDLPPFVAPVASKAYPKYFDGEVDLNVIPAWDQRGPGGLPLDGKGVTIGIVDDGVQLNHPDIDSTSVLTGDDKNILDGLAKEGDPTPPFASGGGPNHGTAVAGLIIARRNNNKGVAGIAPGAKFAAYRAIGGFVDPATFAEVLVPGATRAKARVTEDNPFGLTRGNEWFTGSAKMDISCNPWGYNPNGADLVGYDLYIRKALAYGITQGRVANSVAGGIIYVVPAGNDGESHGDTNHQALTNSIYTLTVGSISDIGRRVLYSNPGASLRVVAPSNGLEMAPRILLENNSLSPALPPVIPDKPYVRAQSWTLTPDEWDHPDSTPRVTQQVLTLNVPTTATGVPGYNPNFGRTSASCAMATGVVALMLEANPRLGWRDVQEIIMRSAKVIDPIMGEWQYNALGMPMSHKYGAGLIDANHAVLMSKVWQNLGNRSGSVSSQIESYDYREVKPASQRVTSNTIIPDNAFSSTNKQVVNISFAPPAGSLRVEHVVVRLKVKHGRRGDLGIMLSSPKSGQSERPVESYLFVPHREDYSTNIGRPDLEDTGAGGAAIEDGEYWDFMSVQHWGTGPQNQALSPDAASSGSWTLTIWDNTAKPAVTTGTFSRNANVEDRVFVPVGNPVNSGATTATISYAEIFYHGTTTPSTNQPPVITNTALLGQTGQPFQASVRAVTDLTDTTPTGPIRTPRAPITDYRVRVINSLSFGAPEMIIAPSTSIEYLIRYPAGTPTTSLPFLRFDRATGLLTNNPYPDAPTLVFRPLPKESWLLEFHATNIFGTTRKQVALTIADRVPYGTFLTNHFSPAELLDPTISGPSADPDGDGVPNLLEYGVGGNPRLREDPSLLPFEEIAGTDLTYTYQVDTSTAGYVITPQVSNSLTPGTWNPTTSTLVSTDGRLQTRIVRIPIVEGTRNFFRLSIAPP